MKKTDNLPIEIDYVFPWVNNEDPFWQEELKQTSLEYSIDYDKDSNRFKDWGLLKYYLRGIEKNLPFIRTVHLIVSSESQIPEWINRNNIHIVYHKDIIPKKRLPIFNSTCIECYMHNIKGLSEYFIYGNDDMYSINRMYKSDFFDEDLKPKIPIRIVKKPNPLNQYRTVLCNCEKFCRIHLNIPSDNDNMMLDGNHSIVPMYLPLMKEIYNNNKEEIDKTTSQLRVRKNLNQQLWNFYTYLSENASDKEYTLATIYKGISDYISKDMLVNTNVLCLNDVHRNGNEEEIKKKVIDMFETILSNKSRYEL